MPYEIPSVWCRNQYENVAVFLGDRQVGEIRCEGPCRTVFSLSDPESELRYEYLIFDTDEVEAVKFEVQRLVADRYAERYLK